MLYASFTPLSFKSSSFSGFESKSAIAFITLLLSIATGIIGSPQPVFQQSLPSPTTVNAHLTTIPSLGVTPLAPTGEWTLSTVNTHPENCE